MDNNDEGIPGTSTRIEAKDTVYNKVIDDQMRDLLYQLKRQASVIEEKIRVIQLIKNLEEIEKKTNCLDQSAEIIII